MTDTEIFSDFTFEAAHRLPNVAWEHKCSRLHGHSFTVRVHVLGEPHPTTGWIIDFAEIADAFRVVHDQLDHNYLNALPGLDNPTSENLARWIYNQLAEKIPVAHVTVQETSRTGATYPARR